MKTVKLKLSEDKARSLYPDAAPEFRAVLEETFGKGFFRTNPMEWIDDFDDVLEFHGLAPSAFTAQCKGLAPDEVAYKQLKLIVAAYNGNELPDWDDSDQRKYYPWFDMRSAAAGGSAAGFSLCGVDLVRECSNVGSRLVFLNRDHALDAVEKFLPIYKALFTV